MQGGNHHIDGPRRSGRAKALGWGATGLATAVLLIGGSLAALEGQVSTHGDWQRFTSDDPDRAVVLPPAPRTQDSFARRAAERPPVTASVPEPVLRGTGGTPAPADATPSRPAPADPAPKGEPAGTPVTAELDDPAAAPAQAPAERVARVSDTDGDGLADRAELELGTDVSRGDTDGDTLPDGWETRNLLDPKDAADAAGDDDGDGLVNRTEFRVRSNPRVLDTDGNGRPDGDDDTDGDKVPNVVEQGLPGADPTLADSDGDGVNDGDTDGDGDGVPTAIEVATGSDPARPDSGGDQASPAGETAPGADPAAARPQDAPQDAPEAPLAEPAAPATS